MVDLSAASSQESEIVADDDLRSDKLIRVPAMGFRRLTAQPLNLDGTIVCC